MARPDPIPGTTISVRVPDDIAAEVVAIARVEGVNVSEVIRAGINRQLAWLCADPEFLKRARRRLEEDREILERYAEGEAERGDPGPGEGKAGVDGVRSLLRAPSSRLQGQTASRRSGS